MKKTTRRTFDVNKSSYHCWHKNAHTIDFETLNLKSKIKEIFNQIDQLVHNQPLDTYI